MAVFHTDISTHKLVQQYCKRNGFQIKQWMSGILRQAIDNELGVMSENKLEKIAIKGWNPNTVQPIKDEPWTKPPFWAR